MAYHYRLETNSQVISDTSGGNFLFTSLVQNDRIEIDIAPLDGGTYGDAPGVTNSFLMGIQLTIGKVNGSFALYFNSSVISSVSVTRLSDFTNISLSDAFNPSHGKIRISFISPGLSVLRTYLGGTSVSGRNVIPATLRCKFYRVAVVNPSTDAVKQNFTADASFSTPTTLNDALTSQAGDWIGSGAYVLEASNTAPVADAGPDQTGIAAGALVTLDGSGSSDADPGDTLTYLWTPPAGITLSSNTVAQPTFTAPSDPSPQTLVFDLIVNDGTVDSPTDSVSIGVLADAGAETHNFTAPAQLSLDSSSQLEKFVDFQNSLSTTVDFTSAFSKDIDFPTSLGTIVDFTSQLEKNIDFQTTLGTTVDFTSEYNKSANLQAGKSNFAGDFLAFDGINEYGKTPPFTFPNSGVWFAELKISDAISGSSGFYLEAQKVNSRARVSIKIEPALSRVRFEGSTIEPTNLYRQVAHTVPDIANPLVLRLEVDLDTGVFSGYVNGVFVGSNAEVDLSILAGSTTNTFNNAPAIFHEFNVAERYLKGNFYYLNVNNERYYDASDERNTATLLFDAISGQHATLVNGPQFKVNTDAWGLTFDGIDDIVNLPNYTMPSSGIVEFEIDTSLITGSTSALLFHSNIPRIIINVTPDRITFNPRTSVTQLFLRTDIILNQRLIFKASLNLDTGEVITYLDGVVTQTSFMPGFEEFRDRVQIFSIGKLFGSEDYLDGEIYSVKFIESGTVVREYKNNISGTETVLPELIGGLDGTLVNFATDGSQWTLYEEEGLPSNNDLELGLFGLFNKAVGLQTTLSATVDFTSQLEKNIGFQTSLGTTVDSISVFEKVTEFQTSLGLDIDTSATITLLGSLVASINIALNSTSQLEKNIGFQTSLGTTVDFISEYNKSANLEAGALPSPDNWSLVFDGVDDWVDLPAYTYPTSGTVGLRLDAVITDITQTFVELVSVNEYEHRRYIIIEPAHNKIEFNVLGPNTGIVRLASYFGLSFSEGDRIECKFVFNLDTGSGEGSEFYLNGVLHQPSATNVMTSQTALDGFKGLTTNNNTWTNIATGFNVRFAKFDLYSLQFLENDIPVRNYDSTASNGTGLILPDTVGGLDATLVNFATDDSQWNLYQAEGTPSNNDLELGLFGLFNKAVGLQTTLSTTVDFTSGFEKHIDFQTTLSTTVDSNAIITILGSLIASMTLESDSTVTISKISQIVANEALNLDFVSTVSKIVDFLVTQNLTLDYDTTFAKVVDLLADEGIVVDITTLSNKIVEISSTAELESDTSLLFNKVSNLLINESINIDSSSTFQKIIDLLVENNLETTILANVTRGTALLAIMQMALSKSAQLSKTSELSSDIQVNSDLRSEFGKIIGLSSFNSLGISVSSSLIKQPAFAATNAVEVDLASSFNKISNIAAPIGMQLDLLSTVERATQVGEFLARMTVGLATDSNISKNVDLDAIENNLSITLASDFIKSIHFDALNELSTDSSSAFVKTAKLNATENDLSIILATALNKTINLSSLNEFSLDTASEFGKIAVLNSATELEVGLLEGTLNKRVNLNKEMGLSLEQQADFVKESILNGDMSLETLVLGVFNKTSNIQVSQDMLVDLSAFVSIEPLIDVRRIYNFNTPLTGVQNFKGQSSGVITFSGNITQPCTFKGKVND